MIGTHNMSYAHTDGDIEKLLSIYDNVFAVISEALVKKDLKARLKAEPLVPLLK